MKYAFFFVTSIAVAASFFLIGGVATGIIAVGTAELLMRRARIAGSGVDAALWLGGLVALIASIPSHGQPEGLLLLAAAAALAGARVRNPWFGALAVVIVLHYLQMKGVHGGVIAATAQAIAVGAALARARTWHLASTDRLFGAIAIAAPLVVFKWPIDLAGGAIVLALALRLRDRMLLLAAAVSIGIAAFDIGRELAYPVEWELIAAGAALVVIAVAVTRALRGRTHGIVVAPAPKAQYEEIATILLQPHHAAASSPDSAGFEGGGGDAGGAGATESF